LRNIIKEVLFEDNKLIKEFILDALGKKVGAGGFILDSQTNERVLTFNKEEVKVKEFGGIRKGSEIIFKSDIGSVIDYLNTYRS